MEPNLAMVRPHEKLTAPPEGAFYTDTTTDEIRSPHGLVRCTNGPTILGNRAKSL
jgi:hypothetical protein